MREGAAGQFEVHGAVQRASCIDVVAQANPADDCRVDYFAAWLGPADPKTGRGPADYVGVNEDANAIDALPAPIPPHEFVHRELCGPDCLRQSDAVGEWALEFPSGDVVLHDTQGDAVLLSDGSPVDYRRALRRLRVSPMVRASRGQHFFSPPVAKSD